MLVLYVLVDRWYNNTGILYMYWQAYMAMLEAGYLEEERPLTTGLFYAIMVVDESVLPECGYFLTGLQAWRAAPV
jgi:hypothetical protein